MDVTPRAGETGIESLSDGHPRGRLFVVGCSKSGTTWVMNLLGAHPQIVVRGEGSFAWKLTPILTQAVEAFNRLMVDQDPITHLGEADVHAAIRVIAERTFERYVQASGRAANELRYVGDKTPQHAVTMPLLHQMYPEARFVHIIRDPRDAAVSAWYHLGVHDGRPFDEYITHFITEVWALNVSRARAAGAALDRHYHEVKYEQLIEDERHETSRMLEFLEVDASPEAIEACCRGGSFEGRTGGRRPGDEDTSSFYRSGTAGGWSKHLPLDLAARCCQSIAELMTDYGYEPNPSLVGV